MAETAYLICQQHDHEWGLVTTTVGLQQGGPGVPYPYGEHPDGYMFSPVRGRVLQEYTLVYLYRGSGWFQSVHCQLRSVSAGDAFLLFPNEWHSYSADMETGWSEAWVGFTGPFADSIVNARFFERENPVCRVGINDDLLGLFSKAYRVADHQGPAFQQHLAGYVALILSSVYAESRRMMIGDDDTTDRITLAKHYMRSHLNEPLNMEILAHEVGLGYSKFRKDFKVYTGFSPARYFIELKLSQARALIRESNMSIKQIAFGLGFKSLAYFNEVFKKYVGVTPGTFRFQAGQPEAAGQPD